MAENTSNLTELTESQKKLQDAFTASQNSRTTAEAETARLNTVSQEAYKQTQLANAQAQNQFAQNQAANQLTALDAIRRSNASAIANGANAGLSAANQLSSILGLQQDTSQEATDIANTSIDAAAQLNTQLNENAVEGARTANELNAALGANEAELAKAIASNNAAIADVKNSEITAQSQERIKQLEAQLEQQKIDMQKAADALAALSEDQAKRKKEAEVKKAEEEAEAAKKANEDDGCVIPGTKITLADGSYKNVEDITDKDTLLVWDIVEGGWKKAPVLFVEHDPEEERDVIKLEFDNNISLGIIDDHGLFNTTLMKYVYIKTLEDAMQYIGHEFFYRESECYIKKLKLNNATVSRKKITAHSPCTAKHLCVIANDILTMPGNTEPFTNVCDVNPDTLCYDNKQLFNYIETFGLFSEKDFEGILPPSIFFAFQGPLLKIKIAKGGTSMEEVNKLIERYSEYLR
jgi:hypothetical protein